MNLREALKNDGRKIGRKVKQRSKTKMVLALTLHAEFLRSCLVIGKGEHVVSLVGHRWVCNQTNGGESHKTNSERMCSHEYAVYRYVAKLEGER